MEDFMQEQKVKMLTYITAELFKIQLNLNVDIVPMNKLNVDVGQAAMSCGVFLRIKLESISVPTTITHQPTLWQLKSVDSGKLEEL